MGFIFWGILLVFLDFGGDIGAGVLGLIPDFVGYLLIAKGLREIAYENRRFAKLRAWAIVLTLFTVMLYVIDLVGAAMSMPYLYIALSVAVLIGDLYVSFQIVKGLVELEEERGWDLRAKRLKTLWLCLAVMESLIYLMMWFPLVSNISMVASFIVSICFLFGLRKTWKLFDCMAYSE